MFGRKQKLIENYRTLLFQERNHNLKLLDDLLERIRDNAKLREQLKTLTSVHNAFTIVEDYLLNLSEELRQDGSTLVYREKHKNNEGNIFVSENKYEAMRIDIIARALYEIEKSERRQNEKTKLDF